MQFSKKNRKNFIHIVLCGNFKNNDDDDDDVASGGIREEKLLLVRSE